VEGGGSNGSVECRIDGGRGLDADLADAGFDPVFVAKLTSKFQITIPVDIRRRLGLHQGDAVVIDLEGDKAVLRPVHGGMSNA